MAIKKDQKSTPKVGATAFPPTSQPLFAPLLARAWRDQVDDSDREHAVEGTRLRNSFANN